MMPGERQLFFLNAFGVFGDERMGWMRKHVGGLDDDALLGPDEASLVAAILEEYRLTPVSLDTERLTYDEVERTVNAWKDYPSRRPTFQVQVMEVTIHVPFVGHAELLDLRPTTSTSPHPEGRVEGATLKFTFQEASADADKLRAHIEGRLQHIREYLKLVNDEAQRFNQTLKSEVEAAVHARTQYRRSRRDALSSLGLRRRTDVPAAYQQPLVPRKLTLKKTAQGSPVALPMEEYEMILGAVTEMGKSLERSPTAFAAMGEEALRWVLLVPLNIVYTGTAMGETFNFAGKTDILVRNGGETVFLAECKIWDGPQSVKDAIDQLRGYATWRDTRLALIVFNRTKNITAVIDKIRAAVREHPACKAVRDDAGEGSLRFTLGHPHDSARALALAVLVFEMPRGDDADRLRESVEPSAQAAAS